MEERLQKLEHVIADINTKLHYMGAPQDVGMQVESSENITPSVDASEFSSTISTVKSTARPAATSMHKSESILKLQQSPNTSQTNAISAISCSNPKPILDPNFIQHENEMFRSHVHFFESHSFLSVLSARSLKWLGQYLDADNQDLIRQFERLPYYVLGRFCNVVKCFVDPIEINSRNRASFLERPLLGDLKFYETLLNIEGFENDVISLICPIDELKTLMTLYFSRTRPMNYSELLLVCSGGFICLLKHVSIDLDAPNMSPEVVNVLSQYSNTEIIKQLEHLLNAAILLFHRVSIIGHGTITVQAIIMLIFGIEASGSSLFDVNTMLLSTAIRFAKGLGLHRAESYASCTPAESKVRRKIWFTCIICDIEFCYRNGKAPILSEMDVAISAKTDFTLLLDVLGLDLSAMEYFDAKAHVGYLKPEVIARFQHAGDHESIFKYFHYVLTKLRFHAYFRLFLTVGNLHTVENLEMHLDDLNAYSTKLSRSAVGSIKPTFYDDPSFPSFITNLISALPSNSLVMRQVDYQFLFFYHVMIINRVPFLTKITNDSPKISTFRKLFLRSARTVLQIGLKLNSFHCRSFSLTWLAFYPFAAFLMLLTVVINNSSYDGADDDMRLLLASSCHMFGLAFEGTDDKDTYTNIINIESIIMKIFAQIGLVIVESQTGRKAISEETLAVHRQQLKYLRIKAPEIFYYNAPIIDMQLHSSYNEWETLASTKSGNQKDGNNDVDDIPDMTNKSKPTYNPVNVMNQTLGNINYPNPMSQSPVLQPPGHSNEVMAMFDEAMISNLLSDQMNTLPNFFFDNSLGFDV